uniref:RNA-directed DNA polymerase, eukaryota n=1 Tax=Tanacetum cinerariifolium TaxID=118510 RepID=A0A6L2N859_TANCI|nr:RNA-directed DNA polymerase, eukaryota [Tanacetum cinerariifolium]
MRMDGYGFVVTKKRNWIVEGVSPYGRIVDSYIARKPSKVGKRFGFVRFIGVLNEEKFARSLADIWIGNHHIYAAVARFQRSHSQKDVQKQDSEHKKVNRKVGTSQPNFPNSRVNHLRRSYASMVHGDLSSTNRQPVEKKTLKLNDPDEGFSNVKAHHVGGFWTWLEFQTSDACLTFKTNDNLKWMFASIIPVQSNFVIDERSIWIDINGLPLCAVCIATKYKKFIDEEVSVEINGEPFTVYVRELSNWSTKIEEENESEYGSSDNDQVENIPLSDESCRQEEYDNAIISEHEDDMGTKDDTTNVNQHEHVATHDLTDLQEHVAVVDKNTVNHQEYVVTHDQNNEENQKHEASNGDAVQSDTSCPPDVDDDKNNVEMLKSEEAVERKDKIKVENETTSSASAAPAPTAAASALVVVVVVVSE